MYSYNSNVLNICILKEGIYGMGSQSATGKSYLSQLLHVCGRDMVKHDKHYSIFNDESSYDNFEYKIDSAKPGSLLVLDRLDFYFKKEWLSHIVGKRNELYILADFKRSIYNYIITDYVKLNLTKGGCGSKR